MRACLSAIVEAEHRFDDAIQLCGQVNVAAAAAIGTPGVTHPVQLDSERRRELRGGAGENDRAARGVLLLYGETMRHGKRAHRGEIRRVGAVDARKLISSEVRAGAIARSQGRRAGFEFLRGSASN
jgi:hypothetical protein